MRKLILVIIIVLNLATPAWAMNLTAPTVPQSGAQVMPDEAESFGEGLWSIVKDAISLLHPELADACRICFSVCCGAILLSLFQSLSGITERMVKLVSALMLAAIFLQSANTMIRLAADTVTEISEYGKLLLPVMAAAMAAQGAAVTSTSLYTATAVFSAVLNRMISGLLIPCVYSYLALSVAASATDVQILSKIQDIVKRFSGWCLKTILSVFIGFISITGAVSGATDAAALKVTRAAISGMVPVVGGILSDASEAVLVGAGMMKNTAGVYGMLAALAVCIGPFLQIGAQYLLLKATGAFCEMFAGKQVSGLVQDFSSALGLLLGMTGSSTVLLMISTICFMKGMG